MTRRTDRLVFWSVAVLFTAGVYACGSSSKNGATGAGGSANGTGIGGAGGNVIGTNEPPGSQCSTNGECASGFCNAGTCSDGLPGGSTCTAGTDCTSGVCVGGTCQGNGIGAPPGTPCDGAAQCASGVCDYATGTGLCGSGTGLPDGRSCSAASECASGACTNGICGTGTGIVGTGGTNGGGGTNGTGGGQAVGTTCTTGSNCASGLCVSGVCAENPNGSGTSTTTTGPHYGGSGDSFRPMTSGCGPSTADECTGTCEQAGGDPSVQVIRPPATLCFSGAGDVTPNDPTAVIEQSIESINGVTYVHIRVTFDPSFVDNTYGANSCSACGWNPRRPHTFVKDLTASDHTELLLTNGSGTTVSNFKIDYISADPTSSCGYGTLGVTGGDGIVITGDPSWVLASSTSMDRNLNGCGYCTNPACGTSGDCTVDSPATDPTYASNPLAPNWDFREVYEVWIDYNAFGSSGFGQAYITYVHASPNKSALVTIDVTPTPCPPTWDTPYCPPNVVQEGGNCFGGSGGSGNGGAGGGGTTGNCPVNYQVYITSEGASICTPIPFANYDGMAPCPSGYTLDLASEGQYCVPI